MDILHYIDALLMKPNLQTNEEFIRNMYELWIDIANYYGDNIRSQIRQMQNPKMLRDCLNNFRHLEGMDDVSQRFMTSMSRIGCV